jgi:hypothetical protein
MHRSPLTAFLISLVLGIVTSGQTLGGIKGLILDSNDARVAKAKIHIESKSGRQTLLANDQGEYSIDLPEGTYKLRADMAGFYPSKARKVRIVKSDFINMNFTLHGIRNDSRHP